MGSTIELTVSAGTSSVVVPDVVGFTLQAATKEIESANLKVDILQEYSDTVAEGLIISQSPEGDMKAPQDSTVVIKVSLGQAVDLVTVPSVLGKYNDDAVLELTEAGFTVNSVARVYSNIYAEDYVCYQSVEPGTSLPKGSNVDIQVSLGAEDVLYRYNASINAPSTAEDPDFVSGTEVKIVITTVNGKELSSTSTTSFPHAVNLWNISGSNSGIITLTYEVKLPPETETNEDGDEIVVTPGKTETRSIKREINFEIQE